MRYRFVVLCCVVVRPTRTRDSLRVLGCEALVVRALLALAIVFASA